MGHSSIESKRRTMIKIAIVACLAALAAAEADADAWYQPYGYSNWNNNWMGYSNWNMYNNWNRPGMQEGYRYNYGKRSADAEPEPEADAWYQPYGYSNWGYSGNNWWNRNNMMSYWNRPYNMYNNMYNRFYQF